MLNEEISHVSEISFHTNFALKGFPASFKCNSSIFFMSVHLTNLIRYYEAPTNLKNAFHMTAIGELSWRSHSQDPVSGESTIANEECPLVATGSHCNKLQKNSHFFPVYSSYSTLTAVLLGNEIILK